MINFFLLHDINFWILVSFAGFLGVGFRPLKSNLFRMLDARSAKIKDQFLEVQRIHIEAEEFLLSTKEHHQQIVLQITEILELADQEIRYLQDKTETEEQFSLSLRENLLAHRIRHNYQRAQEEIREFLVSQTFEDVISSLNNSPPDVSSTLFFSRFKKALV